MRRVSELVAMERGVGGGMVWERRRAFLEGKKRKVRWDSVGGWWCESFDGSWVESFENIAELGLKFTFAKHFGPSSENYW
jgi:hypothetical protein